MSDESLMWDEVTDIGHLLHELDDASFDTPSLCAGWVVRDVVGHMGLGHTTPFASMTTTLLRYHFNVSKASLVESKSVFAHSSPDEIRTFWDNVMIGTHPKKGISHLVPSRAGFLDHLVHNQDIRRPTGRARTIPAERLSRALELVRRESTPMFSPKKNIAGLTLRATDIGWSAGAGPLVQGPGEALVMAAAGRSSALEELDGDGLALLKSRITGGVIK